MQQVHDVYKGDGVMMWEGGADITRYASPAARRRAAAGTYPSSRKVRAEREPGRGGAHGAIKACFLVLTTRTRVQTVLLHPYTRTDCTTPSVQLYRWDDPFRTGVQPRRVEAHSCTARITRDVQLCGRGNACRTVVRSDSFAMHSSTYYLAGSGLTFEIMRFGSNIGRDF